MAGSAWALNADNGSPEYHAAQARRLLGGLLFGGVSHRLGARQGVRPGPPVVQLSGTTVQVLAHQGVIYPGETSTQGPYPYEEQGESLPLDPADGSQTRVDLVVERLWDDDVDSSGERKVEPELVPGTPGGGAPSVPSGGLELARVTVPASGQGSPSLSYTARSTVASGGILPVPTLADLPSAGRYAGMSVFVEDIGRHLHWGGSGWLPQRGWFPINAGQLSSAATAISLDVTRGGLFPAGTFSRLRVRARGASSATHLVGMRLNSSTAANYISGIVVTGSNGTVVDNNFQTDLTVARLAQWSTAAGCTLEVEILDTDQTALVSWDGGGVRVGTSAAAHTRSVAQGRLLSTTMLLDTILLATASGAVTFSVNTRWWLEGYR